jgi:two-component system, NtrC family, nitrogen regulation response regulator NtrX
MPSVLIVDDEPNIRRMVGALLGSEGFEVRDAADARAGYELAIEIEPDLVLLDLMMPGPTDGLELLEKLRAKYPDLPVVMMSGRAGARRCGEGDAARRGELPREAAHARGVLLALGAHWSCGRRGASGRHAARRPRARRRAGGDSPAMRACAR